MTVRPHQSVTADEATRPGNEQATGELLQALLHVQETHGYLPLDDLEELAARTQQSLAQVRGFASRFSEFDFEPQGRFILEVCDGTACHALGTNRLVNRFEELMGVAQGVTTPDGAFTLRRVHCVGACSLAPVVRVATETFARVRLLQVTDVLRAAERMDRARQREEGE